MDLLNLPAQQIVIYLAIGIGTAIAAALSYQKGRKEQAEPLKDVIIREASIADMSPVRETAFHAKECARVLEAIHDMMADEFRRRAEREEAALKDELARARAEIAALRRQGHPGA